MHSLSCEVFNSNSRQNFTRESKDIVDPGLGLGYNVEYWDYMLCQKDIENARGK